MIVCVPEESAGAAAPWTDSDPEEHDTAHAAPRRGLKPVSRSHGPVSVYAETWPGRCRPSDVRIRVRHALGEQRPVPGLSGPLPVASLVLDVHQEVAWKIPESNGF